MRFSISYDPDAWSDFDGPHAELRPSAQAEIEAWTDLHESWHNTYDIGDQAIYERWTFNGYRVTYVFEIVAGRPVIKVLGIRIPCE